MQKLLQGFSWFLIITASIKLNPLFAQCNPPPAETCGEAFVFCSLDEMNGYSCSNYLTLASPCNPFCSKGGKSENTSWYAFICEGGIVSITLNVGFCQKTKGLEWGVWELCPKPFCANERMCSGGQGPYSSKTLQADFKTCKTYYLAIDGLDGDICDFTINTSGGGPPVISPLQWKNLPANGIREICLNNCFYIELVPQVCKATFQWTVNGIVEQTSWSFDYFWFSGTKEGDFEVCVTAFTGEVGNGSICSTQGPLCGTIKVRKYPDRIAKPRILCWEQANPKAYKWHSQNVNSSGTYTQTFPLNNCCLRDSSCCKFDSIVEFIILPEPEIIDVNYIGCINKPYVDVLGRAYSPCNNNLEVVLPKSTGFYKCDSTIRLSSVLVDFSAKWIINCNDGMVELSPNVIIDNPCNIGESYQFEFSWYTKSNPGKIISKEENLLINPVNEDYCLKVDVFTTFGTNSSVCSKIFCDPFNEGNYAPECFILIGDTLICNSTNGTYHIDSLDNSAAFIFSWDVKGGKILSKPDSNSIEVNWNLNRNDTGFICANYKTECGTSCKKCLKVLLGNASYPYAGKNDSICGLNYTFQGKKDIGGFWTQIDGPSKASIKDSLDPESEIMVSKYGKYLFVYNEIIGACNNTDTLELTFGSATDSTGINIVLNFCDSAIINKQVYHNSNNFTQFLKSTLGCDSIVNTTLNINYSNNQNLVLNGCDSILINNIAYSTTGQYTQILSNEYGCDSTLNLNLTIGNSSEIKVSLNACDSIVLNGIKYNQSGSYHHILTNASGCDSVVFLELNIPKSFNKLYSFNDCDSVVFQGKTYTKTGHYPEIYSSVNGCDSIIDVFINITNSNSTSQSFSSCDSFIINGIRYNKSGHYIQNLKSTNGCDSIINLDLKIANSNTSKISLSSCDSIQINGYNYFQSGNYTQLLTNTGHCDSVLSIELNLFKSSIDNFELKACDSLEVNGKWYFQSENTSQTLMNSNGCDSIINSNIIIAKSNSSNLIKSACDSVIINGTKYYQSGNYIQNLNNTAFCDSMLTIYLDIHKSSTEDYFYNTCDSAYFNGFWYHQTGNYIQSLKSIHQCDSIIQLHLNISKSSESMLEELACDSILIKGTSKYSQKYVSFGKI